jgi:hypothetical protein
VDLDVRIVLNSISHSGMPDMGTWVASNRSSHRPFTRLLARIIMLYTPQMQFQPLEMEFNKESGKRR